MDADSCPALLDEILPVGAAGIEVTPSQEERPSLFAGEESLIARAVPSRCRDAGIGRACARRALGALGISPIAIPADPRGVPQWPIGVVGSITHTTAYVAAVVAWQRDWRGIGIDAEKISRVHGGLEPLIATRSEVAWLDAQPADRTRARTLLFSAKEAVYKCQFPITDEVLDFLDLDLVFSDALDRGSYRARFRGGTRAHALPAIEGRFIFGNDHVVTIATLR